MLKYTNIYTILSSFNNLLPYKLTLLNPSHKYPINPGAVLKIGVACFLKILQK